MNTNRKAFSAGAWSITGYAISQVARLVGNIILARVLFEEAFALMAIVGAVIQGLSMFSDVGLGPNVVQNRRGESAEFLGTIWTVQIVRGLCLCVIASGLAFPIAWFYSSTDPLADELKYLLPLAALATAITGFNSTRLLLATRRLDLARVTVIDLISQIAGIGTVLLLAVTTRSLYSLPIGAIVSAVLACVLSHTALPGERDRLHWDPQTFREILRFGKWVFVSTIASFLALQVDRLALPKLFPLDVVGVYAIAVNLALLVPTLMARLQMSVAFPVYAATHQENAANVGPKFDAMRRPMLHVAAFLTVLTATCAPLFIEFAYDARYAAAGLLIALLSFGSFFSCVEQMYGAAYLALGESRIVAASNAAKVLGYAALLIPSASHFGIVGACGAVVVAEVAKAATAAFFRHRIGRITTTPDLTWATIALALGAIGYYSSTYWQKSSSAPPLLQLLIAGALVVIAFSPAILRTHKQLRAARS
jgi:O-antigen/teichoic acid export membrane protein